MVPNKTDYGQNKAVAWLEIVQNPQQDRMGVSELIMCHYIIQMKFVVLCMCFPV
jgi:hypothetical protein